MNERDPEISNDNEMSLRCTLEECHIRNLGKPVAKQRFGILTHLFVVALWCALLALQTTNTAECIIPTGSEHETQDGRSPTHADEDTNKNVAVP
jgi:hypothetical protein